MQKQIFVGGWGGSGSRVLQQILQRAGFYVGELNKNINEFYDFDTVIPVFFRWYRKHTSDAVLREVFEESLRNKSVWSLKWGHFMYMIPKLKEWYPQSKFILTVRHPIDNVLNEYTPWHQFENKPKDLSLEERLDFYEKVTKAALLNTDFIFRLEDFCFKPRKSLTKLFQFIGIEDKVTKYYDIIKVPESIGRRKNLTSDNEIIKILGY